MLYIPPHFVLIVNTASPVVKNRTKKIIAQLSLSVLLDAAT